MINTTPPRFARVLTRTPVATYRVQMRGGMTCAEVGAMVPYLASLGITDCYLSPVFVARTGSAHGYDICDPSRVDEAIGGERGLRELAGVLAAHHMGLIIDIVPNHMAADELENPWWRSVLTLGLASPCAHYFDIDWDPPVPHLQRRVLLPVLEGGYGDALHSGQLEAVATPEGLAVRYGARVFPINPAHSAGLDPDALNGTPGKPATFDALHALLERQIYRLADWRTAADELNYRRFFDVDGLIGVRVEADDVFAATHAKVLSLVREGVVTGLRIDHPDGLARPGEYFAALDRAMSGALADAVPEGPARSVYTVAEKVLINGEWLPGDWMVEGTTGYEFLNSVNGILVDRASHGELARVYASFVRSRPPFADLARQAKLHVMDRAFGAEVNRLATRLAQCAERARTTRDLTYRSLRKALLAFIAALPVYRTYVDHGATTVADMDALDTALRLAKREAPDVDPGALTFLHRTLTTGACGLTEAAFVQRFQQFTGAVFAKAVEDTAFFRDNTLIALNEVGGNPARPGIAVSGFHQFNARRLAQTPLAMSTTATHDTKLGEDARARLDALTELVPEWASHLRVWRGLNQRHHTRHAGALLPDRHDEYRFYQSLVAAWPPDGLGDADALTSRIAAYMEKSSREAKRRTSWTEPDPRYEKALSTFVTRALTDRRFIQSIGHLAAKVGRIGVINSLTQTTIKITAPGVPDFYQGTELWDLHLVDPDNRGLPDQDLLASAWTSVQEIINATDRPAHVRALLDTWPDGRIKMLLITCLLHLRRAHADVFDRGSYEPLHSTPGSDHSEAVGYLRRLDDQCVLTVAPRLVAPMMARGGWPLAEAWGDRVVILPEVAHSRTWRHVLTGTTVGGGHSLALAELLRDVPAAVLVAQ